MSSSGHYDQSLLSQAAAPTRQQLQEGYRTDLLNPAKSSSPSQTHPNANADYESGHAGLAAAASSKEHLAGPINGHGASADRAMLASSQRSTPFWRSRNGIIAIVVGLLVILAIAVGVGVGVSQNRSNNKSGGLETSSSPTEGLETGSETGSGSNSGAVTSKPSFTDVPTTFTTTSTQNGPDRSPTATVTLTVTTTTAVEVTGQTQPVGSSSPIKEPAAAADAITSLGGAGGP